MIDELDLALRGLADATKGGLGSGHWAHDGRPGLVGGSAPGGGFARLGFQPDMAREKLSDLARLWRNDNRLGHPTARRPYTRDEISGISRALRQEGRLVAARTAVVPPFTPPSPAATPKPSGEKPIKSKVVIGGLPDVPAQARRAEITMSAKTATGLKEKWGIDGDDLKRMYVVDDPAIKTEITVGRGSDGENTVDITYINAATGASECHNDYLEFNADYEGRGYATSLYARQLATLKARGFAKVTIYANISVGKYAWARQGFDYAGAEDAEMQSRNFARWATAKRILKPKMGWPTFHSAKEVADYDPADEALWLYGKDISNSAVPQNMKLHLGKAFMLDTGNYGHGSWYAVLNLKDV